MDFEDLPKEVQDFISNLKYGSPIINKAVGDIIEEEVTIQNMADEIVSVMEYLKGEAQEVIDFFNQRF
tara:strand:+ start:355 stop:558 length:204 start_codon:yes stop_codon:yes gene_type:complete